MEVDTETGMVKIRKYACVDDVGNIVNPLIVEGQVHGGLAQGIAQALYEEAVYDADGNLTTGTFVDYLVPSANDLPHFDTGNTVHAATSNPLGAKGVGEAGCIASTPAVVNAALDAVRHLGCERHPHAADTRTRLAGDPPGRRRRGPRHRGHERLRRGLDRDLVRRVHRRVVAGRGPMIPAPFAYARPTTLDEALQAVASGGEDVKILAGGQSLIPVMRLRLAAPETIVDLTRVTELRGVREDGDAIVIGAMTTHSDVLSDPLIKQYAPLIAEATETVADRQVRHRGTFGGALAHCDPAGDLPAVALALDAEFVLAGPGGRRTVPAADFFVDYLTTALEEGEILVEIRVPKREGWGMHYEKFNRVAQAWSIVAVAAAVRTEGGRIAEARIGLTNMGPTPLRATATEQALTGAEVSAEAIKAAADQAAEGTSPSSDLNAQADYRQHLATVLTRRAVSAAAGL